MLSGEFTSDNDDDFTPQSAEAIGKNLQLKADGMVPGLNSMIGQDICLYVDAGTINVVSVALMLTTDGASVSMAKIGNNVLCSHHIPIITVTRVA